MAFHIGKEALLACTVGQISSDSNSFGVSYKDILVFKKLLCSLLPKTISVNVDDIECDYVGDSWQDCYYRFQKKYKLKEKPSYSHVKQMVAMEIEILKDRLIEAGGVSSKNCTNPIDLAIDAFKEYYTKEYEMESTIVDDSLLEKRISQKVI